MKAQEKLNLIEKALTLDNDGDMVATIIENVGNVKVEEIDVRGNEFEVFMYPSGFTGREIENLKELFNVKEIGVYGDPEVPEDTVYFHMVLEI